MSLNRMSNLPMWSRRFVGLAASAVLVGVSALLSGCPSKSAEDAPPPSNITPGEVVKDAGGTATPGGSAPTMEPMIAKKRGGAAPPGPPAAK